MIMELTERVKAATGSAPEIVVVPYDEEYCEGFEDMARRQPNTDKLWDLLGWEPDYGVDVIIADVIDYYRGRS